MSIFKKLFLMPSVAIFVVGLGGCPDEGPAERAGEEIDEITEEAGEEMEEAGDEIDEGVE